MYGLTPEMENELRPTPSLDEYKNAAVAKSQTIQAELQSMHAQVQDLTGAKIPAKEHELNLVTDALNTLHQQVPTQG